MKRVKQIEAPTLMVGSGRGTKDRTSDVLLRESGVLDLLPIGRSTWWEGVKSGRYPKPVKLGPRITAWWRSDVLAVTEDVHG